MDKQAISRQVDEMPWIKKATVFLRVLDHALENLKGTSKNYLRCHRCVKNRLGMLIYNS